MRLPSNPNKYISKFKWVEIAHYVPELNKVIREQKNKEPILIEWNDVSDYVQKRGNTGIYTSIFRYDQPTLKGGLKLGNLYFDLDSDNAERARLETVTLVSELEKVVPARGIRIYFTGLKGFHVECEAVTCGINPTNRLPEIFRYIATTLRDSLGLSTLDFAVYDQRRMWRLPYSLHQRTGLYKCEIEQGILHSPIDNIKEYAREPAVLVVPDQSFDFKANEWYREFTYKMEESKLPQHTPLDYVNRFTKYGTSTLKDVDTEREFNPVDLFDNCPAILKWWKYAEEKRDMPHEARLFLCSILTYTDEAIEYLHAILANCDDYNYEISQAHIDDWVRRREAGIGGRPYSCERANAVGVGCGDCKLEEKNKWIRIGDNYIESNERGKPSPIRYGYKRKVPRNNI